jgi:NAD+ synthase (glutamine-hydrolysing)
VRLALCQLNAVVGDISGNAARIVEQAALAREQRAELVLFPELALTGYPPEDLLLKEHFLADARRALDELACAVDGIVALVGFPERADDVYNAAAVIAGGEVRAIYRKNFLPNYGVFDEQRYFQSGSHAGVIDVGEQRLGVTVCEDIWEPGPPLTEEAQAGATLILNISASPYHAGKGAERERMFQQRARDNLAYIAFCALVGGQDELVFDGHSCVVDPTGATIARAAQFREELLVCDVDLEIALAARLHDPSARPAARRVDRRARVLAELRAPARERAAVAPGGAVAALLEPEEAEVYAALRLGLHDYVEKNGFEQVVLGLSGGIDSALVACVAADTLGPERVNVTVMPSPYSSTETQADARALAGTLGTHLHELPIADVFEAYRLLLHDELLDGDGDDRDDAGTAGPASGRSEDLTEENLQARIRGNLLMALSNRFGWLVLATGNKSEMSVGYTTLYGDLAGGFAVIKDVPKTLVYRLARWRNSPAAGGQLPARAVVDGQGPIPTSIIERAPSAELRAGQRDEDSLPPYELLDRILHGYIELDYSREQLIAQGLPAEDVARTIELVDRAEYKRRQAPPGIKITTRAFGRDRRMPITNRYRG